MGLIKDYSLAIVFVPGLLNLLVVPDNKRKLIVFSFIDSIAYLEFRDVYLFLYLYWLIFSEYWCNGLLKYISFT